MKQNKHPTEKLGRKNANNSNLGLVMSKINTANAWLTGLNRNAKLAIVLALALVIIGIISFQLSRGPSTDISDSDGESQNLEETDKIVGLVKLIEGTLQKKDAESDWVDIEKDAELKDGIDLRTVGAVSKAIILLPSGTEIRIDANTEVYLELMTENRIVLNQKSGYIFNRVVTDSEQSYIVKTSDAQYQAQGTAFKTTATGDEQSVEVFHKQVIETTTNKNVNSGQKLVSVRVSDTSRTNDESLSSLDIEELKKNPFIIWNRQQDLASELFKNELGFLSDFDSPEINISGPAEGTTILIEPTEEKGSIEFSGTTERGSTLTVLAKSNSNAQAVKIALGDNGAFISPLIEAPTGDNVFEFIAKDRIGNTTTKNFRLTIQKKSQPVAETTNISLAVEPDNDSVNASWVISGANDNSSTVQLIYSKNQNPKLGEDGAQAKEVKDGNSVEIKFNTLEAGNTYYFVACIYDKNKKCTAYSSQKSLLIP